MKIFLDARNPQFNGSWTYIKFLLPQLVKLFPENHYIVLYDRVHGRLGLENVDERVARFLNPGEWLIWSHTLLPRILEKEKVDIYHGLKQIYLFGGNTARIYTVHGAHHFVYPQIRPWYDAVYWKFMTTGAAKAGGRLIAGTESDKRNLCYWGAIREESVEVVHLAADERFRVIDSVQEKERVRQKLRLETPFLLYVGRVDPYKNVVGMVKAFARAMHKEDTGHAFVLVGDKQGYRSSGIFELVKELNVADRMVFTGHLSEDLEVIYNLADAFLFPSLYEGFGLAALEAMACGLPVISARVAGCTDVVGDAGILVDPLDVEQIADSIVELLTSKTMQSEMRKASLERAKQFSWGGCARETFAIYERLYHR